MVHVCNMMPAWEAERASSDGLSQAKKRAIKLYYCSIS